MGPQTIWRQTLFLPNKSPKIHQLSKYLLQSQQYPPQKKQSHQYISIHHPIPACSVWHESPVFDRQESDEISETTKKSPGQSHKPQAISMADCFSDKSYPPQGRSCVYPTGEGKKHGNFHGSTPNHLLQYVDSQG